MRLHCEAACQPVGSVHPCPKSCKSILTLAPGKNQGGPLLIVSTTKNAAGQKYKIQGNIDQVFKKFVDKGQVTIKFKEPSVHLFIKKANAIELGSFLKTLGCLLRGQEPPTRLSQPPSKVKPPTTKLYVLSPAALNQLCPTGIFPRTLEDLTIQNCQLGRLCSGVASLRSLRVLDLSHNRLAAFPSELAALPLVSLNLSHNLLQTFFVSLHPRKAADGPPPPIAKSLQVLNLQSNQLKGFRVRELQRLHTLDVANNLLTRLPEGIGLMPSLKILRASYNQLVHLPSTFPKLKLSELDLANNAFHRTQWLVFDPANPRVSPLLELAANAFLKTRAPYDATLLPHTLVHLLDNHRLCVCGNHVFSLDPSVVMFTARNIATCVTVSDPSVPLCYGICMHCRPTFPR